MTTRQFPAPPGATWLRGRSFSTRVTMLVAAAVGVAIALVATASYVAVERQLHSQINSDLYRFQTKVFSSGGSCPPGESCVKQPFAASVAESDGYLLQLVYPNGQCESLNPKGANCVPPSRRATAVANDRADRFIETTATSKGDYRIYTFPLQIVGAGPAAMQVGIHLTPTENLLRELKRNLSLVALIGILLALMLGYLVARASLRPIKRLTWAAEHVARTQDLSSRIIDSSEDELGRMARAFNEMMGALDASRQQQAQLVSDAGHELRTPLTSLRTNIEFLMRAKNLPESDRDELLEDVRAQLEELTTLIGDIVDTARQDERPPEIVDIEFEEVVARAVERARRRATTLEFRTRLEPGLVAAPASLLERALLNILDNAAKWSPTAGVVDVHLTRGEVWTFTVRDQGPGIAQADLPRVFDRFYRAPSARSMPGSGLGLAIVHRLVTGLGGDITIESPSDGGTLVTIHLPVVPKEGTTEVGPPSSGGRLSGYTGGDGTWPGSAGSSEARSGEVAATPRSGQPAIGPTGRGDAEQDEEEQGAIGLPGALKSPSDPTPPTGVRIGSTAARSHGQSRRAERRSGGLRARRAETARMSMLQPPPPSLSDRNRPQQRSTPGDPQAPSDSSPVGDQPKTPGDV